MPRAHPAPPTADPTTAPVPKKREAPALERARDGRFLPRTAPAETPSAPPAPRVRATPVPRAEKAAAAGARAAKGPSRRQAEGEDEPDYYQQAQQQVAQRPPPPPPPAAVSRPEYMDRYGQALMGMFPE